MSKELKLGDEIWLIYKNKISLAKITRITYECAYKFDANDIDKYIYYTPEYEFDASNVLELTKEKIWACTKEELLAKL